MLVTPDFIIMNNAIFPHCLLCGSDNINIRHTMTADEILKCWAIHGCHFDAEAVQSLKDENVIHLYKCSACDFLFFDPRLEGNPKFYGALFKQLPIYYVVDSPENLRNTRFAVQHGHRKILDVGCGDGSALDNAKRAGLETYGIEPSPTAAAAAAARGHTIFPMLLNQMDAAWNGKFDLISFNQVLEHVSNPVDLIQESARLLSPRGVIAVAVPNNAGILRFSPWLEFDWPPHHLSRWKIKNFYTLARLSGLHVIKTGGNRLEGREIKSYLLGHRQRCQVLQKPYRGASPLIIRAISAIYRILGLHIFCHQGHSIYCYMGNLSKESDKLTSASSAAPP
jgi:2-polyprenyl-3-methyl-5-hydroxy-6-metoxy-1,4-benzoquinol methylase